MYKEWKIASPHVQPVIATNVIDIDLVMAMTVVMKTTPNRTLPSCDVMTVICCVFFHVTVISKMSFQLGNRLPLIDQII